MIRFEGPTAVRGRSALRSEGCRPRPRLRFRRQAARAEQAVFIPKRALCQPRLPKSPARREQVCRAPLVSDAEHKTMTCGAVDRLETRIRATSILAERSDVVP